MSDNYLVLARKYRPNDFDDLVAQDYVKQTLVNALNNKKLHHGFLFTGTRGVGKTTIARILAKSLNCQEGISSKPCGVCDNCKSITLGSNIDVIEIDAASNTQVDKIRSLLESAQYTPSQSRFKIYIIDEMHMLSTSSFNALLKVLEEPPQHIKFIFATTDPQKIPITILSRCLQFNLKRIPTEDINKQIIKILTAEKIKFDETATNQIAELGDGSMRDALSILDQAIAFGDNKVTQNVVTAMLGIANKDNIIKMVDAIFNKDFDKVQQIIEQNYLSGINLFEFLKSLAKAIHEISISKFDKNNNKEINNLAAKVDNKTLQIYYQIITLAIRDAKFAVSDKVNLEMCILRMLSLDDSQNKSVKKKL